MNRQPLLSKISISLAAVASILMFAWPLLIATDSRNENLLAQGVFMALMPLIIIITLVEFATGEIGSRQLAILGVMTAINAVVRLLGAGTAGIETAFFLIIIGAYVFRSGFGFILGSASILVSALLGAGVQDHERPLRWFADLYPDLFGQIGQRRRHVECDQRA